jgi:hypothetical protein
MHFDSLSFSFFSSLISIGTFTQDGRTCLALCEIAAALLFDPFDFRCIVAMFLVEYRKNETVKRTVCR